MESSMDLDLPSEADSPATVRRALRDFAHLLTPQELEDLQLVFSELVSNSIRHAGLSPKDLIKIHLEITDHLIRGAVADGGPGIIHEGPPYGRGYGLQILDRLATRWGTSDHSRAQVWFEIERH
ncbi:MAG: ATP-binding protein [Acidimicrobiia bacterium]